MADKNRIDYIYLSKKYSDEDYIDIAREWFNVFLDVKPTPAQAWSRFCRDCPPFKEYKPLQVRGLTWDILIKHLTYIKEFSSLLDTTDYALDAIGLVAKFPHQRYASGWTFNQFTCCRWCWRLAPQKSSLPDNGKPSALCSFHSKGRFYVGGRRVEITRSKRTVERHYKAAERLFPLFEELRKTAENRDKLIYGVKVIEAFGAEDGPERWSEFVEKNFPISVRYKAILASPYAIFKELDDRAGGDHRIELHKEIEKHPHFAAEAMRMLIDHEVWREAEKIASDNHGGDRSQEEIGSTCTLQNCSTYDAK